MGFIKTEAGMDQLGFVRGPAMIYAAPITTAHPADISDVIKTDTVGTTDEVQTLSISGTPTGGTFKLSFRGAKTGTIAYNATSANVVTALEALATVGGGNVTATGGPLPGTPVVITFAGTLSDQAVPLIVPTDAALTGGTTPAVTVVETTPGVGQYDPIAPWFILGGTKDGVNPTFNDAEEEFTIDQQTSPIGALPSGHDWGFTTSLAEVTPENLALALDMGPVTLISTASPVEKQLGMGTPNGRTQRRFAIIHRREVGGLEGLLRMHYYRIGQRRAGNETTLSYAATGEQQRAALNVRALPDSTISDPYLTIGYMRDQQPS